MSRDYSWRIFIDFKYYNGIDGQMIGGGNNLYVYGGTIENDLISGYWNSIFVGNKTSEEIEFVQPFHRSLNASTIYASSCPNSIIHIPD